MKWYTYILYLLWLIPENLPAQTFPSYHIAHYDVDAGLTNNLVFSIAQDEDDYLWIATQYGLNRFDGRQFKSFTYRAGHSASLGSNWVKDLHITEGGHFFIATQGTGMNRMDLQQYTFDIPDEESQLQYDITNLEALTSDHEGNLWLGGRAGLFLFHNATEKLVRVSEEPAHALAIASAGVVFFGGIKGLFKYEKGKVQQLNSKRISAIHCIDENHLLVIANNALVSLHLTDHRPLERPLGIRCTQYTDRFDYPFITADREGYLWMPGAQSLWRLSTDLESRDSIPYAQLLMRLPATTCKPYAFYQDREGSLWIGTDIGLFQLVRQHPMRHPVLRPENAWSTGVRETWASKDQVWQATSDRLLRWQSGQPKKRQTIFKGQVNAMRLAADGHIYSVVKKNDLAHLIRIDTIVGQVEKLDCLAERSPDRPVWNIVSDRHQRLWWILWNQLFCYDVHAKQCFSLPIETDFASAKPEWISLYCDDKDVLWMGSMNQGLFRVPSISSITADSNIRADQFIYDRNDPQSISSDLVMCMHRTEDETLWVGTDGGLNRMRPGENNFDRFLRSDRMPDDKILSLTSDDAGNIWAGTVGHGILCFNPKEDRFQTYGIRDGLYDNSMLYNSVFRDEQGYIWMGSAGGIQYFHPDSVRQFAARPPKLHLESVTFYDMDTSRMLQYTNHENAAEQPLHLHPGEHSISFHFVAPTYQRPAGLRYRFRLEAYHDDWLPEQADGDLIMTQLPPGTYKLRAEAFSAHDGWKIAHPLIYLNVMPPWYQTRLAYTLYAMLAFIGFILTHRFRTSRRNEKAAQQKREELTREKQRWFNRIAHEFRTPLTVILGALDRSRQKNQSADDASLQLIEEQTIHLSNQVEQIMELALTREGRQKAQLNSGDFIAFQQFLVRSFDSLAVQKKINLLFQSPYDQLLLEFDEDKWRKITSNLISNALKFTEENGQILVELTKGDASSIVLTVSDNGRGMSPEFQRELFEPFRQENPQVESGSGLGLAVTQELVQLMGGSIAVSSETGKGSSFVVRVPAKQLQETPKSNPATAEKNATILIAEDHPEVMNYLRFCLEPVYELTTATDGKSAWDLCLEQVPDLVVSDIMMPGISGLQLCERIKQNPATDHVPVILLTAKLGEEARLKGLKTGADVYLTKPFRREELLVHLQSLLDGRRRLWQKYQSGFVPDSMTPDPEDEFMRSVNNWLEQHYTQEDISIQQMARDLYLSRTQLFRKMKALTGQTPTLYLRTYRLRRARRLILESRQNLSEIAFACGFKDPAYFSRVYAAEFGHAPSHERS